MIKTSLTAAALSILAVPALAQEVTFGKGELGYGNITNGDEEISALSFSGEIEYSYSQFLFGVHVDSTTSDFAGDDVTIRSYGASAAYAPITGVLVGAGLTGFSFSDDFDSESYDGYELFGQYTNGQYSLAASYAVPVSDEDDFDITTFFAEAAFTPEASAGIIVEQNSNFDETIFYVSGDYDAGQFSGEVYYLGISDVDGSMIGANGAYEVSPVMSIGGTLQSDDLLFGGGDSITYIGLDGSYMITDGVTIDAYIGQISGDGAPEDVTSFGLSLTYMIGEQTRVDRRMAAAARDNVERGFGGVLPSLGFSILPID